MTVLNFPATPTLDDTYTANGVTYKWNGNYWEATDEFSPSNLYVNKDGDNMTGDLTLGTDKITLATDGSSSFVGDVVSQAQLRSNVEARANFFSSKSSSGSSYHFFAQKNGVTGFAVDTDGTTYIGGTIPAAPNITLKANGEVKSKVRFLCQKETDADYYFAGVNASGDTKFVVNADGSAEFAGNVKIEGDTNALFYRNYTGSQPNLFGGLAIAHNGVDKTTLMADGSATFAGRVISGGNPASGAEVGSRLNESGIIQACNTGNIWHGFEKDNSTPTSVIAADGTASFAGGNLRIQSTGRVSNYDTSFNGEFSSCSFVATRNDSNFIWQGGRNGSSITSTIDADGAATFAGTLQNAVPGQHSYALTYGSSVKGLYLYNATSADSGSGTTAFLIRSRPGGVIQMYVKSKRTARPHLRAKSQHLTSPST